MRKTTIIILILALGSFACKKLPTPGIPDKIAETTILISLDGFRYDYTDNAETPVLDALVARGVKANGLIPVFPSKTFPNHYSQVTGLYPVHHGIISNNMYDPETDEYFRIGAGSTSAKDGKWYGGEPIWVTAEKQEVKAATYFWPGSEAEIENTRPSYWKVYDGRIENSTRVKEVLEWLELPKNQRPAFVTLYFSDVDNAGHAHGPDSDEVKMAVEKVDSEIGLLVKGLSSRGWLDRVNIIIVSDHGMAQLSRDRMIFLDDYIDLEDIQVVDWTPVGAILPQEGKEKSVFEALHNAHPEMKVYQKANLPEKFHYNGHRLIQPIICIANEGWSISNREFFDANPRSYSGGTHGYDPAYTSMHGLFVAAGPAFKEGQQIEAFENIHLYEMMCKIMELTPAENDGDLGVLESIFRD